MGGRGLLLAIDDASAAELLAARTDHDVRCVLEPIEEEWDHAFLAETDKAWAAIHCALTDGTLSHTDGGSPAGRAILGGRHLHRGDDFIITFVSKDDVPAVAAALAAIDDDDFRRRYDELIPRDFGERYGPDDREYTTAYFREVAELYKRAAAAGRSVVFSVDQ